MKFNFDYPPQNNNSKEKEENKNFSKFYRLLKKASIGALLFTQLSFPAKAADIDTGITPKEKNKDDIEKTSTEKINSKSNTYIISSPEITKSTEVFSKRIEFNMISHFEVDSHEISSESVNKMQLDLQNLLNNVDESNYLQIIEEGVSIFTGTDERKTNKYKGGNKELAEHRANEMKKVFLDFLNSKAIAPYLKTEQFNELKSKLKIDILIPKSEKVTNPEEGVVYPEDIGIDRNAFNKMTNKEKEESYQKCRVVSIGFDVEIKSEISKEEISWDTKSLTILFDDSPSMKKSFKGFLSYMTNEGKIDNENIKLGFFSGNKVEARFYKNMKSVLSEIDLRSYEGSDIEKTISAMSNATRAQHNNKELKIIRAFTDEPLQGISLNILEDQMKMAIEKNSINEIIYKDINGLMRIVRLDEVRDLVLEQLSKEAETYKLTKENYKDHIIVKSIDLSNVGKIIK